MPHTIEVALNAPLWSPLTYAVPDELAPMVGPLTRVMAPLRRRLVLGFALGAPEPATQADETVKPIADVLDDPGEPAFPPAMLSFFSRAAAHYFIPLGQALAQALPAGLDSPTGGARAARGGQPLLEILAARPGPAGSRPRTGSAAAGLLAFLEESGETPLTALRERFPRARALARRLEAAGWLTVGHRPLVSDLMGRPILPEPEPARLTDEQQAAVAAVGAAVAAGKFAPFLLEGVTGSGKTEVYLAACRRALEAGRGALVLTPEIGLCLRLEGLLKDRLGPGVVAVLHSGLSPRQRRDQWRDIAAGRARVVVGARSAVFAPLADPGVICVDEEQDEAYKQEDRWRYHARDLALLRGQEQGAAVLLGTATPAVTTWRRAERGDLTRLELTRRVGRASLPELEVVDLRSAGRLAGGILSRRLLAALDRTVAAGDQAILFLNRRGFAPAVVCESCGKPVGCPACEMSLTVHKAANLLSCHLCGHTRPLPAACPTCGAPAERLRPVGLGTEQVAERLAEMRPDWRLDRLDRDAAGDTASLRRVLGRMAERDTDVLVGTQMITKGHHLPGIALVGVLLADQAWALPDYRASERAYCMLVQAAGRAGREGGPGRMIVQAFDPGHPALRAALAGDGSGFYAAELAERRDLGYPPFRRLIAVRLEGVAEAAVDAFAARLAAALTQAVELAPGTSLLGPAPALVARAFARHRRLMLIKAPAAAAAQRVLRAGLHRAGRPPAGVRVAVDVDPLSLL